MDDDLYDFGPAAEMSDSDDDDDDDDAPEPRIPPLSLRFRRARW